MLKMVPKTKMLPLLLLLLLATAVSNALGDIRLPPSITDSPSPVGYYGDGARVVLRCVASGVPPPQMSWTKDGSALSPVGIIPFIFPPGNGTIEIVQMSANHSGTYRCLATNAYGRAMSELLVVQLATLNFFDLNAPMVNYTVQANAPLRLACNPPASVPQAVITWSWNSTYSPIQTPVVVSRSFQIDYTGSLCFASVNISDVYNRLYRCNAFNEGTQATASGAYSRIIHQGSVASVAPQLVFSTPSPYIGLRSQQTILRCFFSGTGTMTYQWTYNGASALPPGWTSADTEIRSPETGTADTDAGLFTCYGNNGQGTPASRSITLTVEAIPDFRSSPERVRDVNVTEGDAVVFSCATNAIPQATVQWFKDAQPFTANSLPPKFSLSADLLTLTIADLCKNCSDGTNDLMVVQCIATNNHGHVLAQGYVNVLFATVIESEGTSVAWAASDTYVFDCLATCDDSTPCSVQWSFAGRVIEPDGVVVVIGNDGSLTINTTSDSDAGLGRIGDYECRVTNGYSQQTIVYNITGDVDECRTKNGNCNQNCTNTIGSYFCSCFSGYQLQNDGHTCEDINECTNDKGNCSQQCINLVGSFECKCDEGYELQRDHRSCKDIDECSERSSKCVHNCSNTIGNYTCSCQSGFQLQDDRFSCNGAQAGFESSPFGLRIGLIFSCCVILILQCTCCDRLSVGL